MKEAARVSKKIIETGTETLKGIIFNIQRYSLHDGPGIRTVVFFKGCPLACQWCCNPESIDIKPQITYNLNRCLRDGRCLQVCPTGARTRNGYRVEDCIFCGTCVEACPSGALELLGKSLSVSEAVEEVEKDRLFYETSGGGATLSGGEVLVQRQFAVRMLEELRKRFIHTAVETSGFAPWRHVEEIVDACDLVLYDLKHMNSNLHGKFTGVPNELILENALRIASKIASMKKQMVFRLPLIGGVNTDRENIEAVAHFAHETGVYEVHLLPYHRLGESKYRKLGKEYSIQAFTPDESMISELRSILESYNLIVKVGG